jgi:uncharacterized radical SAM superfamily Fe-S cluster-containing enzyme
MKECLGETVSLCPECLERISARKVSENGSVFLEKECDAHGRFKTLIWRGDAQSYLDWGKHGTGPVKPLTHLKESQLGCPFDCGLCSEHQANTCSMIMLVTHRCNLACPVCLASAGGPLKEDPDLRTIEGMYKTVLRVAGSPTVQLSGGEPTLRDDLPEIISMGKHMGFRHVVINSNGIRIAKDRAYVEKLAQAGAGTIYLQFDGLTNDIYQYTRGTDIAELKIRALENCRDADIGVVLVPTLIPAHNGDQLGGIISLAKEWIPTVRGVHIQPISYFGRFPHRPHDADRVTIPEVIEGLVSQTRGELEYDDFSPRRSDSSYCSFSGLFVLRNRRLQPLSKRPKGRQLPISTSCRQPPWESARSFLELHWQLPEGDMLERKENCSPLDRVCHEVATHGLAISCMPFQDVWNIDLERLSKCCLHVATPEMTIIPFCAYYLTSTSGKRLHYVSNL